MGKYRVKLSINFIYDEIEANDEEEAIKEAKGNLITDLDDIDSLPIEFDVKEIEKISD